MPESSRILHVFSTFGAGGPQVRTCTLIRALGAEFTHVVVAVDGQTQAQTRIEGEVNCRVIDPPSGKGKMLYSLQFVSVLRTLRPALLVTYNWGAFDAVIAGIIHSGCAVLHTEDGFGADEANGLKRRRVWLRRLLLNRVDNVVVPSKTLLDVSVNQYRVRRERVRLIPNGIDVGRFHPGRNSQLRERWGVSDGTTVFGYTGRLAAEKNLPLLLEAFALAGPSNAKLVLVGDGPERPGLEELARGLGIAGRVVFAGGVIDVAPYYRAFDVFVMSSVTEQMPISLLEAMGSGLPAIVTDVGDCAEMLANPGYPAILPCGSVVRYAESIRLFAANPALRRDMGSKNRARCMAHFSLEQMVSQYGALYRSAIGRQASGTQAISQQMYAGTCDDVSNG